MARQTHLGDVPASRLSIRFVVWTMLDSGRERAIFSRLVDDARRLRQIAGDVAAFGSNLSASAAAHLDRLHDELAQLEAELRDARPSFLAQQPSKHEGHGLKLHLGCGPHLLPGWVNIDAKGGDIRMDLRWPLPFPNASARYVFASHVLEHFYRKMEVPPLVKEIRRILAPGGVLRVVVPDVELFLRAYVAGDEQFFADRARIWPYVLSYKTRLDQFLTYVGASQVLEDFDGHMYGYDFETLASVLNEAGFTDIKRSQFMASSHPELRIDEASYNAAANSNGRYYSLFVEAS